MVGILSGCVAAAIPVVAGGAVLRSGMDGRDPALAIEGDTPKSVMPEAATSDLFLVADPVRPRENVPMGPFANFLAFAEAAASMAASDGSRDSALLAEPASLSAELKPCAAQTPSVLIDLDPAGGMLPAELDVSADPDLSVGLSRLRRAGVEIAWISGQSAAHAGALREALAEAGLDPDGDDTLLLMRYPGDRKQTRREDLAARTCLVAIAGDEREDFDELYAYLVNPEAALGLELLIGDGWFLVPSLSLSEQRPTQ
ncbi:hypothetical protein [Erythrobacter sp.]|uniref:hypothetical protein n=1 Tax=Erythrobacter sp. TaxID=1042 RepID=UPI0025BA37CB|nr:hypothetical protein [Erythrobacter sp.]